MRRPNIMRPVHVHTTLPEDIKARMDLYLWSDVEQRIPKGAFQRFLMERIAEFFNSDSLDVSKYRSVAGGTPIIRGSPAVIEVVRNALALHAVTEVKKDVQPRAAEPDQRLAT